MVRSVRIDVLQTFTYVLRILRRDDENHYSIKQPRVSAQLRAGGLPPPHKPHRHLRDAKVGEHLPAHAPRLPRRARLPVHGQDLDAPVANQPRDEAGGLGHRETLAYAWIASRSERGAMCVKRREDGQRLTVAGADGEHGYVAVMCVVPPFGFEHLRIREQAGVVVYRTCRELCEMMDC